jgi:uncharacterized protein
VMLVMDRVSGRWVTLDARFEPLLRLLAAPGGAIPESLRPRLHELAALLRERSIGIPETERRFGALSTIIIKLTNACNLACTYCYDFERSERARRIELAQAVEAIRQGIDLCEDRLWVILHGGEPMLVWPLIEEIVRQGELIAKDRGKQICFSGQSNMTRLTERIVRFSIEHGIDWGVSVDGPAAVHDTFRIRHDGRESYSLFAQSLDRFPRFVRACGVMSTITTANDSILLEIARHFRELGMPSWDWTLFQPIGRGRESAAHLDFDGERLRAAWLRLFQAVEAGEFAGFRVLPITKYLDNFLSGPGKNMCMRPECGAARDLLSVSADGSIEACDCIDPAGPLAGLGHVAQGGLQEARQSPIAESIRARDVQAGPCGECIWFGVCGGTCLAHAPSLDDVWEQACLMSQLAFDEISRSLVRGDALLHYLDSLQPAALHA